MHTSVDTTAARTGLRELNRQEEGTGFAQLPNGVYGFTYAPLSESPLFSKRDYHCFEMQKLADGTGRLVCFVTPAEAEAIRAGRQELSLHVYPEKWNAATEQVAIPTDRVERKNRNPVREEGNRLAVIVTP